MAQAITVVSTKGQIVLPKVFRDSYGLRPGQRAVIREVDGRLVIERLQGSFAQEMDSLARQYGSKKGYSSRAYEEAREHGE